MTISKKRVLPLALALGAVGAMVMASVATATHPRPLSAGKVSTSLVPAFNQCGGANVPNRTHGPPLAAPSCNPPVKSSTALTIGASSVGSIRITVLAGVPGPPEDSDVKIQADISDVRCEAGTSPCGPANASGGADYTGELEGNATIRISDHWNAIAAGGGPDPATVVDLPFPVGATCASTASTAVGSDCSANTSANAVVPGGGTVKDGKRAIVEVTQLKVSDGGPDGLRGTAPNTLFEVQGIFIP